MLAIIIPYYKFTYFEATLQSLACQTDKRFKVYIGDDASLTIPTELLQKYRGALTFVYYRFDDNLGGVSLTNQWERCIHLSDNEEWLMILGDDDVLDPNVVASFYLNQEAIKEAGSQVIRFASRFVDKNQEPLQGFSDYSHPQLEKAEDAFYRNFKWQTRSSLSEYMFTRNSFEKYGFYNYPLAWHSDDQAWLDFTDKKPIYTINEAFVLVRISNSSITGKIDNEILKKEAKSLFFKKLLFKNAYSFSKDQKVEFLSDYSTLLTEQNQLDLFTIACVFSLFIKLGSIFEAFRFLKSIVSSKIK